MYIKKTCGCVLGKSSDSLLMKGLLDIYIPETHKSTLWKYWRAILDPKLCLDCLSHHGQIYAMDEIPNIEPPLHENCRCAILPMDVISPGGATKDGENGADYWLVRDGKLPDYYILKSELEKLGWKRSRSPQKWAPGKMVFGGIYQNKNNHLPSIPGRICYEADINHYDSLPLSTRLSTLSLAQFYYHFASECNKSHTKENSLFILRKTITGADIRPSGSQQNNGGHTPFPCMCIG